MYTCSVSVYLVCCHLSSFRQQNLSCSNQSTDQITSPPCRWNYQPTVFLPREGDYTIISTPNYPSNYEEYWKCGWTFAVSFPLFIFIEHNIQRFQHSEAIDPWIKYISHTSLQWNMIHVYDRQISSSIFFFRNPTASMRLGRNTVHS